jgi:hypothetical protein
LGSHAPDEEHSRRVVARSAQRESMPTIAQVLDREAAPEEGFYHLEVRARVAGARSG